MIKATDLRIDNWVIAPKIGMCQVTCIHSHSDGETYIWVHAEGMEFKHRANLKDLKGVELTPEILESSGFIRADDQPLCPVAVMFALVIPIKGENKNEITFLLAKDKKRSCGNATVNGYWASNNFKHLHQLQNLYFALTGQELTININEVVK